MVMALYRFETLFLQLRWYGIDMHITFLIGDGIILAYIFLSLCGIG